MREHFNEHFRERFSEYLGEEFKAYQNKFQKIEAELIQLTNNSIYQFNQENIQYLSMLSAQQINNFDQNQATFYLESTKHLKKLSALVWDLYKLTSGY